MTRETWTLVCYLIMANTPKSKEQLSAIGYFVEGIHDERIFIPYDAIRH